MSFQQEVERIGQYVYYFKNMSNRKYRKIFQQEAKRIARGATIFVVKKNKPVDVLKGGVLFKLFDINRALKKIKEEKNKKKEEKIKKKEEKIKKEEEKNKKKEEKIKKEEEKNKKKEKKMSSTQALCAKAIRKVLKDNFKGTKFSVKSESMSLATAVRISWTSGPTRGEVEDLVKIYQTYRGMDDLDNTKYEYRDDIPQVTYVTCRRD